MKRKPVGRAATILYLSPIARASSWRRFVNSYLSTRIQNASADVRLVRWSGDDSGPAFGLACMGQPTKFELIIKMLVGIGLNQACIHRKAFAADETDGDARPGSFGTVPRGLLPCQLSPAPEMR
jgi:hypothetical protein